MDASHTPSDLLLLSGERLCSVNEHLRLIEDKSGLTFGTDAFLLAAYVRSHPSSSALELGAGTGIVSLLLLAKNKVSDVCAVEVQPAFAELIRRNAAVNGFSEKVHPIAADCRALSPADVGGEKDLVFANPPYMKTTSGKRNEADAKFIARHEVNGTVFDFCSSAAKLLKYGGKFVAVYRPDRLSELMTALTQSHLEPKRMTFVHADGNHEPSAVLVEARKGAAPSMKVTPPLFLYEPAESGCKKRVLTKSAAEIYETCAFPE